MTRRQTPGKLVSACADPQPTTRRFPARSTHIGNGLCVYELGSVRASPARLRADEIDKRSAQITMLQKFGMKPKENAPRTILRL